MTWLFQKAMSVDLNQEIDPNQINQLLSAVFQQMQQLGEPVLKPFLQDVVQFPALTQTLIKTGLTHPGLVAKVIGQVGLGTFLMIFRTKVEVLQQQEESFFGQGGDVRWHGVPAGA